MNIFSSLPEDLQRFLLMEWLLLSDVCRLDTALCVKIDRVCFHRVLQSPQVRLIAEAPSSNTHIITNWLQWITVRRINLEELCINGIDLAPFVGTLTDALLHLPTLERLNLPYNNIDAAGAASLSQVLPHVPNLQTLVLDSNDIDAAGAASLCEALPQLPNLQILFLSGNGIDSVAAASLRLALTHLPNLSMYI
jgi:Leucine-rich repeat (LRR) protein